MEVEGLCTTATTRTEGIVFEAGKGLQLIPWRNLQSIRLRENPSERHSHQLEIFFHDVTGHAGETHLRKILLDFETRTRRLLFVTRCRQLEAQNASSVSSAAKLVCGSETSVELQTQQPCGKDQLRQRTGQRRLAPSRQSHLASPKKTAKQLDSEGSALGDSNTRRLRSDCPHTPASAATNFVERRITAQVPEKAQLPDCFSEEHCQEARAVEAPSRESEERSRPAPAELKKCNHRSAWARLIRAGSRLLKVRSRGVRTPEAASWLRGSGGRRGTPLGVTDPLFTGSASGPVNSRQPRLSLPSFMSRGRTSSSTVGSQRRRRWPWNRGTSGRGTGTFAKVSSATHVTPVESFHLGEQAAVSVTLDLTEEEVACVLAQTRVSEDERILEDDSGDSRSEPPATCGARTPLPRPKMCWEKPVMPSPLVKMPCAAAAAVSPDQSVCRENSDISVVVVSLASGESSCRFGGSDARGISGSSKSRRRRPSFGRSTGTGVCAPDDDGASGVVVTTSQQEETHAPLSTQAAQVEEMAYVPEVHANRRGSGQGPLIPEIEIFGATGEGLISSKIGTARQAFRDRPVPAASLDPLLLTDSGSEVEFSICESPGGSGIVSDCSVSPSAASQSVHLALPDKSPGSCSLQKAAGPSLGEQPCGTLEFCSFPDSTDHLGKRLFSECAAFKDARCSCEAVEATADAEDRHEGGTGVIQGEDLSSGPPSPKPLSDNSGASQGRHDSSQGSSLLPPRSGTRQAERVVNVRETLAETHGRALVETDENGPLQQQARPASTLEPPCTPPVGISLSESRLAEGAETGSLRNTLNALWDELEAAHRGDCEPTVSVVEKAPLSPREVGTWELIPLSVDSQLYSPPGKPPAFLKTTPHSLVASNLAKHGWGGRQGAEGGSDLANAPTFQQKRSAGALGSHLNRVEKRSTEQIGGDQQKFHLKDQQAALTGAQPFKAAPFDVRPRLPDSPAAYPQDSEALRSPPDSASVVSEMIFRLKENLSEQAGNWWRLSMMNVVNRPLMASYETFSMDMISHVSEIQEELAPGPNENSVFSSNWHDRLQWAFQQVLTLRESQEARPASYFRRRLFEGELSLSHEIGSFAAAARAAAVVLIHSLALEERGTKKERTQRISQEPSARKGPSQCFVRITPEEYPTVWSVYQPKFADDEVYVFDSLVLTAIVGDAQSNIGFPFAKEVYQNDIKGRQAMADAIYATCLATEPKGNKSSCRGSQPRDHNRHLNTVWDAHSQTKFERARLGLPIACLVDYAALAVVVEPLLPLNPAPVNVLNELADDIRRYLPGFVRQCESVGNLFGCFDALDKVDRATYNKFKNIARFLNLADYPFARGASDFHMTLPPAALWRSQVDHFCIFRNLHETLPPRCSDGLVVPEQRFRQTFVALVFDIPLPCTSKEQHKAPETFASKISQRSRIIRGSLEALEVAGQSMELAMKQDVVPVINGLQKNFLDSFDIAHTLHVNGINIRNVAQLLKYGPASPFREAVVREVVARSAKCLFRMQVEKVTRGLLAEATHIEEIQRLVVTLFNVVLSTNEESRIFWLHQILPLALERYKVDLTELASPENVCTYSLFKAMEYNFGVQFDSHVAVRSTDGSGEATLELRLPLTVADLSTFSTLRDSLLFPHISHVRAALVGPQRAASALRREEDAPGAQIPRLRSTRWRMRHFFDSNDLEKENEDAGTLKTGSTSEELRRFAELRAVRGFYPKVQLVAPETFALMQAAEASTEAGESSFSLDVLLENMKAGLVVSRSREQIWGSGNFAMHGVCGAVRAALIGTGYPCHPYCLAVDEDERLREVTSPPTEEKPKQFPLKLCLKYKRKKLALTLALLLKAAIGNDILLLGKILQQTAYIMLQHNEVKAAASIADFICSKIPDALSLQSEALLIDMQCTTKGSHPQDALSCYRNLKPVLIAMEGRMSFRLLLADLLLASCAFKNKRFNAAILHAFRVHRIATVCFDTGGAHWAAIAALRLVARSMMGVQRSSEAIIILQHAVRAASANPELPSVVTHMSRFWLAAAFARMGHLENASAEAQATLSGLESQLGTNHETTMSALYLAADVKMRIGCLALQNPPLKVEEEMAVKRAEEADLDRAPNELQEPLLWKPLRNEDFEIYEGVFLNRSMAQARADAEQLFLALFRRLLFREDNLLAELHGVPGLGRKQRLQQIFSTLKQLLKLKLCSIPISVLRLLAHRLYVACVAQGCSKSLRLFGLMSQEQVAQDDSPESPDEEDVTDEGESEKMSSISVDQTRIHFTRYPRLRVGRSPASPDASRKGADLVNSGKHRNGAPQEAQDDHVDHQFSFYSQQKVSGTERRRPQKNGFMYARVDGASGMRPTQEHDDVMLQLLLFCDGPPSLNGLLKSCYMSCIKDREQNPSTWVDGLISDVITEQGSLQHLRFLLCMLRHFFTLSQKSLFIALAPGDFDRKCQAQILIQSMRAQQVEKEVSQKLILKRMINKSREEMPTSTEDHFDYELSSPRDFDLMADISQCEELLNATSWTGSALRRMRSQVDFTLSKQSLTRLGAVQKWRQTTTETDFVEGLCDDADAAPRATGGAETRSVRRSTMASIEENYLRLPTMGQGSISGKTAWKSMSTAARLSQVRFGGINQFVTGASSVGYGVMRDIFKPQDDSELEAFGCIECLQPADKVPYLGG